MEPMTINQMLRLFFAAKYPTGAASGVAMIQGTLSAGGSTTGPVGALSLHEFQHTPPMMIASSPWLAKRVDSDKFKLYNTLPCIVSLISHECDV